MLAALVACALEIAMAKPPEPLEEIFPLTAVIVEGEVAEVKATDADDDPGGTDLPRQVLLLTVARVVRGGAALTDDEKKAMRVTVTKPKAPYKVKVGTKGPWLLRVDEKTKERVVLGRYGPDSWRMDKIEAKLAELKPAQLSR